ncbi:hypothetical protein [Natronobacterium texcoconense]|uniref:Uncharacterized protein n=1 Tax=Natronobacterium texcoconense TaxID=1095778 RepID=A0A1H1IZC8_NATTX|nr:hypothetical protein [Natronobacterium texcoconense]SDR42706.1 hypothetical protein SAMN04489842_3921 [Natronobacterium texcoconense]
MRRRTLVAAIVPAATAGVAGCMTSIDDVFSSEPETPPGMTVTTYYEVADVLEEGVRYHQIEGDRVTGSDDHYWDVIPDEEAAETRFVSDETVDEFVHETDFENEYLLVVQYGMQSDRDLVPERFERTEDGIHAAFSIETPSVGGDDYAPHSVIARIDDDRNGNRVPEPDEVTVTIGGDDYDYPDRTTPSMLARE